MEGKGWKEKERVERGGSKDAWKMNTKKDKERYGEREKRNARRDAVDKPEVETRACAKKTSSLF